MCCVPRAATTAFAEYRSAGAASCHSPRGDRAPTPARPRQRRLADGGAVMSGHELPAPLRSGPYSRPKRRTTATPLSWRTERCSRSRSSRQPVTRVYPVPRSLVASSLTASEARSCAQMTRRAVGVGRWTAVHTPTPASWTICQVAPYFRRTPDRADGSSRTSDNAGSWSSPAPAGEHSCASSADGQRFLSPGQRCQRLARTASDEAG